MSAYPKTLDFSNEDTNIYDTIAKTVFSDIIVHQRGIKNNLLVIEMKKSTNQMKDKFDLKKLEEGHANLPVGYNKNDIDEKKKFKEHLLSPLALNRTFSEITKYQVSLFVYLVGDVYLSLFIKDHTLILACIPE